MQGMQIYKRSQGQYTRVITAVVVLVLTAWGCYGLANWLDRFGIGTYVRFGVPLAILLAVGVLVLWLMNRPRTADFLIATEGEMKKVSWSSRKEVIGSTKVVIVTTFLLAAILFIVDMVFATLFGALNIMG
jgi:preprotein translocase subunit SecE